MMTGYNFRSKTERNGIESQIKGFECSYALVHLCCYNKNIIYWVI